MIVIKLQLSNIIMACMTLNVSNIFFIILLVGNIFNFFETFTFLFSNALAHVADVYNVNSGSDRTDELLNFYSVGWTKF